MTAGQFLRGTWSILEDIRGTGVAFPVREVDEIEGLEGHPLCAIDEQWRRHLLIPVADDHEITQDRRSAGVQVRSHQLIDREQRRAFVDLVCLKPHLNELFSIVVGEVLDAFSVDSAEPSRTCIRVLERWRELIEREFAPKAALELLVGLFGELWHLREMAQRSAGAVGTWTGPLGTRHDFVAPGLALEVKASTTRRGRFVEIHGPDQLEPPSGGDLYLASMKIETASAGPGERLIEVVDQIMDLAVDRRLLLERLAQLGIRVDDLRVEDAPTFRVQESRVYFVGGEFPRITRASFVGGSVPAGVINLNYQLDLSAEPPFPIDSAQVENVYERMVNVATGVR